MAIKRVLTAKDNKKRSRMASKNKYKSERARFSNDTGIPVARDSSSGVSIGGDDNDSGGSVLTNPHTQSTSIEKAPSKIVADHIRRGKSRRAVVSDEQGGDSLSGIGSQSRLSRHFSLGFLTREINSTKSRWALVFPWLMKQDDMLAQSVHDSILGTESGSSLTSNMYQLICPWFSKAHRQKEEFKAEMRVLARLRHPCITTVMVRTGSSRKRQPLAASVCGSF